MARHTDTCEAPRAAAFRQRRDRPTVADVLRTALEQGLVDPQQLTSARAKVLDAICRCRTAAMGGRAVLCSDCGSTAVFYNSCRNRHCPQCQWTAQEKWIEGRLTRLLDTHYFHVVFTLPAELRPVALVNQRQLYGLLFSAVSKTLAELGRDPRHLGADLGVTAVLHTWARNLSFHPHVHCLVTGGGLSLDGTRWIPARRRYLFPVNVMGALFRGKFLAGLRKLWRNGELVGLDKAEFGALVDVLYAKKWLVYAKRPMAGPEQVITYLGRYTHRVAISNSRILRVSQKSVTFVTRGPNTATLSLAEFTRRFLLHVLPKRFVKIRHYGLFAAANINKKWATAHALRPIAPASESDDQDNESDLVTCHSCGSTNVRHLALGPHETIVITSEGPRIVEARGPPHLPQSGGLN